MKIHLQVIFSFGFSYSQANESTYLRPKSFITVNRGICRERHNFQICLVRSYHIKLAFFGWFGLSDEICFSVSSIFD